jgi:hypothetical protein
LGVIERLVELIGVRNLLKFIKVGDGDLQRVVGELTRVLVDDTVELELGLLE